MKRIILGAAAVPLAVALAACGSAPKPPPDKAACSSLAAWERNGTGKITAATATVSTVEAAPDPLGSDAVTWISAIKLQDSANYDQAANQVSADCRAAGVSNVLNGGS